MTTLAQTLTGKFPIGSRWIGSHWQKNVDDTIAWMAAKSFAAVDLPPDLVGEIKKITNAGLKIGTVDLAAWGGHQALLSPDKARRAEAVKTAAMNIEKAAEAGATVFFALMLPERDDLPRKENFEFMIESYSALTTVLEKANLKLVIEGWPGPGALCCTPETYRAFFKAIPSPAVGVNYDPSHLVRMGIDPLCFLKEFMPRVFHVHGKDTELNSQNLYEFGHEQPAAFTPAPSFGAWAWRYTIPGHGHSGWNSILKALVASDYQGMVSIELEDANFNGTEAGEKLGLIKSREYLEGC